MKRRLAILLAISLAVSPLCAVPARAAEAAETGATLDPEIAAVIEPDTETEEIPGAGGRHVATNSTEAATASAAWSWQVVGKMLQ